MVMQSSILLDTLNKFTAQGKWTDACQTARIGMSDASREDWEKASCAILHSNVAWRINGADFALGNATAECLATDKSVPSATRSNARANLAYYAKGLDGLVPSLHTWQLAVPSVPMDFYPHNPSILTIPDGGYWCIVRLLNSWFDKEWRAHAPDTGEISHNILLLLDDEFKIVWHRMIEMPEDLPRTANIKGAEDIRLFWRGDELWGCATCAYPDRQLRMVLLRFGKQAELLFPCKWYPLPGMFSDRMEKNWMPIADGEGQLWIYKVDPTCVISDKQECDAYPVGIAADNWNGGSQAIPFMDGWLCVIHEHDHPPDFPTRMSYQHRFVWFDGRMRLKKYSERWWLNRRAFQFVCGLTQKADKLIISYGAAANSQAWLGRMDAEEVWGILKNV